MSIAIELQGSGFVVFIISFSTNGANQNACKKQLFRESALQTPCRAKLLIYRLVEVLELDQCYQLRESVRIEVEINDFCDH